MVIKNNRVMEINDLISRFQNADFDGDSEIAAGMHSEQAKRDFNRMFVKNLIEFEHMDELLVDYEHESIFGAYALSKEAYNNFEKFKTDPDEIKDFYQFIDELSIDAFISLNNSFKHGGIAFKINNDIISLFELIVNKIFGIYEDQKNKNEKEIYHLYRFNKQGILKKKNLIKLTEEFYNYLKKNKKTLEFWDRIHIWNKFLLEAGTVLNYSVASFDFKDFIIENNEIQEFKNKLIQNEPFLGFHQNLILFEDYILPEVKKIESGILFKLFDSGARLKSVQLLKAASNTGIPTDIYGRAMPINIKNALLDGLTPYQYFKSGDSARLALQQRQDAIPKGGELQRKFFYVIGILMQDKEVNDCFKETGKEKYFEIEIKNEKYLKTLKYRWYKLPGEDEEKVIKGDEEYLIGKTILLRSPITCQLDDYRICKKCLGVKRPDTKNLGAPVGQYLSEAIIQSVLRAHHFGGVFLVSNEDQELKNILRKIKILENTEDITIIKGNNKDIDYIINYLKSKYSENAIELHETQENDEKLLEIIVYEMPFSEDAVKILKSITSLIDKNRSKKDLIDIKEIFDILIDISNQNGIFNLYFELVLSVLFYDEDGNLYRYSDKEIVQQLSLKDVIDNIDPKLNIFYNFSSTTLNKIFSKKDIREIDHMYNDLIKIYK
jgi:hypothetical protein